MKTANIRRECSLPRWAYNSATPRGCGNVLLAAVHSDAKPLAKINFGALYMIDFQLRTSHGETVVRSGWIVRTDEDFPRLTTCFVLRR